MRLKKAEIDDFLARDLVHREYIVCSHGNKNNKKRTSNDKEGEVVWLQDGEGETVRAYPHKGSGMLITRRAERLLNADLESIDSRGKKIELTYSYRNPPLPTGENIDVVDNSQVTVDINFKIRVDASGEAISLLRHHPFLGTPYVFAMGWSIKYEEEKGFRPATILLHWLQFCCWHSHMKLTFSEKTSEV